MEEACRRCKSGRIELDPVDGLAACTSCGYLADEEGEFVIEAFSHAVLVNEDGKSNGAAPHAYLGRERRTEDSSAYRMKKRIEQLEHLGRTLNLSSVVIKDAGQIIMQSRGVEGTVGWSQELLLAAALYVACRCSGVGVFIPEVAAAAGVDTKALGVKYRSLSHANGFSLPSASLRSLVIRYATLLVQQFYLQDVEKSDATASFGFHPLVRLCVQLSELVTRLSWGEGKASKTLAASILRVIASFKPPVLHNGKPKKLTVPEIDSVFGEALSKKAVRDSVKLVRERLLDLARQTPFGASVTNKNVLCYLDTLLPFALRKETAAKGLPSPASAAAGLPSPSRTATVAQLGLGPTYAAEPAPRPAQSPVVAADVAATSPSENGSTLRPVAAAFCERALESRADDPTLAAHANCKRRRIRAHCTATCATGTEDSAAEVPAAAAPAEVEPAAILPGMGLPRLGAAPGLCLSQGDGEFAAASGRCNRKGPDWVPAEGEEDDARVALGLMTMSQLRQERQRRPAGLRPPTSLWLHCCCPDG